jgi:hypothetical protein
VPENVVPASLHDVMPVRGGIFIGTAARLFRLALWRQSFCSNDDGEPCVQVRVRHACASRQKAARRIDAAGESLNSIPTSDGPSMMLSVSD